MVSIVEYIPSLVSDASHHPLKPVSAILDYLFYIGIVLGAGLVSPLADRYGRRRVLLGISVASGIVTLYSIFCKDPFDVALLVGCSGGFAGAFYPVALIYLSEIVPKAEVGMYCVLFHLGAPVSALAVVLAFSCTQDWFLVMRVACSTPIVLMCCSGWVAESPTFLVAKGEYKEAGAAANFIATYNIGRTSQVEIESEGPTYIKEFAEFERRRASAIFQYPYFWKFESSRAYLLRFSALTFFSCFSFVGILNLSDYSLVTPAFYFSRTAVYLFLSIVIAMYLQTISTWIKLVSTLLFATGVVGILSALTLLYTTALYSPSIFLLAPLSCAACLGSLVLAAVACPCRVRATGFGISFASGATAAVLGNALAESEHELILVFSIAALVGTAAVKWVKRLTTNSDYDDIYEICENRRRFYGSNPIKFSCSFDSIGYGSVVKHVSTLDVNEDMERREMTTPRVTESEEDFGRRYECFAVFPVEGIRLVNGHEVSMGINFFTVTGNGLIEAEAEDERGKFAVEGKIGVHRTVTFAKKRAGEIVEVTYAGQRNGLLLTGQWTEAMAGSGEFRLWFRMEEWSGSLRIGDLEQHVEWLLYFQDGQLFGLGESRDMPDMIQGSVCENGSLAVIIIDADRNEMEFHGRLEESRISGVREGHTSMSFDLIRKVQPRSK